MRSTTTIPSVRSVAAVLGAAVTVFTVSAIGSCGAAASGVRVGGADDSVTAWIDEHAIAIGSTDPAADLADLDALDAIVGDATVVGLGESTHGSHEQFEMKHRMVRYLVEELGFRTVGFENDFASGVLIDRYVVSGDGDARELVSGLSSPMWATEEILDLVEWMRAYNEEHPDDPVRFLGTDVLQLRRLSFDEISAYTADVAPERAAEVDAALAEVALRGEPYEQFAWFLGLAEIDRQAVVRAAEDLVRLVEALPAGSDPVGRAYVDQHARAIAGWYENYSHDTEFRAGRERFIDESIAWWQDLTGSRVAYWAANVHTAASPALTYSNPGDGEQTGAMAGGHIERRLGEGYVSIGTWVGHGEVSSDFNDPHPHPFGPPPAGFLEATLGGAATDTFLLQLDALGPGDVADWQTGAATALMIVPSLAGEEDPATHTMTVRSLDEAFDAIVYIDQSTASRLLGR